MPSLFTTPSPQELQVSVKEKDKRIKELEIELLTSSQKLAAGANDHAEQMQDQADQLDKCKVQYTMCFSFSCSTAFSSFLLSLVLLPSFPSRHSCVMLMLLYVSVVSSWCQSN